MKNAVRPALVFAICTFVLVSVYLLLPNLARGAYFSVAQKPTYLLLVSAAIAIGSLIGAAIGFSTLSASVRHSTAQLAFLAATHLAVYLLAPLVLPIGPIISGAFGQYLVYPAVTALIVVSLAGRLFSQQST